MYDQSAERKYYVMLPWQLLESVFIQELVYQQVKNWSTSRSKE